MMGRLTKDPETRRNNDKVVSKFSIAVDRRFEKDKADFFNVVSFGKLAEFTEKYLTKGTKIALTGRIQNESYEKDGKKTNYTEIIAEEMEFAESKKTDTPKPAPAFIDVPDDAVNDLPFK